jgi:hypothetical protein
MIPSFLLAKLYVKGSLKNTDSGFEFSLKNIIDSAMLIGIGPITVGDKSYEGAAIRLTVGDRTVTGTELSQSNGLSVRMGALLNASVAGDRLAAGMHKITVTTTVSGAGKLKFEISDNVAE